MTFQFILGLICGRTLAISSEQAGPLQQNVVMYPWCVGVTWGCSWEWITKDGIRDGSCCSNLGLPFFAKPYFSILDFWTFKSAARLQAGQWSTRLLLVTGDSSTLLFGSCFVPLVLYFLWRGPMGFSFDTPPTFSRKSHFLQLNQNKCQSTVNSVDVCYDSEVNSGLMPRKHGTSRSVDEAQVLDLASEEWFKCCQYWGRCTSGISQLSCALRKWGSTSPSLVPAMPCP